MVFLTSRQIISTLFTTAYKIVTRKDIICRALIYCYCKPNISYSCSFTLKHLTGETQVDFYFEVVQSQEMQCVQLAPF